MFFSDLSTLKINKNIAKTYLEKVKVVFLMKLYSGCDNHRPRALDMIDFWS